MLKVSYQFLRTILFSSLYYKTKILCTYSFAPFTRLPLAEPDSLSVSLYPSAPSKNPKSIFVPPIQNPPFLCPSFKRSNKSHRIHHLHKQRPQTLSTKSPKIQSPEHKVIKQNLNNFTFKNPSPSDLDLFMLYTATPSLGVVFTGVLTVLLSLCFNILFLLLLILL